MKHPYGHRFIDPLDLTVETFDPKVIGISLSKINRYNGNGRFPISVGQHSILLTYVVPMRLRFAALMHDTPEVFCGDTNGPLLSQLAPRIVTYQDDILRHFSGLFHYPFEYFTDLQPYDKRIANDERKAIFETQADFPLRPGFDIPVEPCDARTVAALWERRFYELTDNGIALQLGEAPSTVGSAVFGSVYSRRPDVRCDQVRAG